MGAAKNQPSWAGERPPTRKLVKDMNGSGKPSCCVEILGSDTEKGKEEERGIVRRQLEKLKGFYRKEK